MSDTVNGHFQDNLVRLGRRLDRISKVTSSCWAFGRLPQNPTLREACFFKEVVSALGMSWHHVPWVFLAACTALQHGESRLTKSQVFLYILSLRKICTWSRAYTLLQIVNTAQYLQKGSYLSQVSDQRSQRLLTLCCPPPPIFHVFPPGFFAAGPFFPVFFVGSVKLGLLWVFLHLRFSAKRIQLALSSTSIEGAEVHDFLMQQAVKESHGSSSIGSPSGHHWINDTSASQETSTSFFVDWRSFQPFG